MEKTDFIILTGMQAVMKVLQLSYFIFYFHECTVRLFIVIFFIAFNAYAYTFTILRDPGIIKPKSYGQFSLEDLELVDDTIIRINVDEDTREVLKIEEKVTDGEKGTEEENDQNDLEEYNTFKYHKYTNSRSSTHNSINGKLKLLNSQGYCSFCNNFKATGVSHCYACEYCILDKDHHCPVLNNCIGRNNIKSYFLFILTDLIQNTMFFTYTNISIHVKFSSVVFKEHKIYYIWLLFLVILTKLYVVIPIYNLFIVLKFYYFAVMGLRSREYYTENKKGKFSVIGIIKRLLTFRTVV